MNRKIIGILSAVVPGLIAVLLFMIPVLQSRADLSDSERTADGYAYVKSMEEKDPAQTFKAINTAKPENVQDENMGAEESVINGDADGTGQTSGEAEAANDEYTEKVMALVDQINGLSFKGLSDEDIAMYQQKFSNSVVVGDSMAQAVLEYGLLDESHVFYERGASIGALDEQINGGLAMLPRTLIFFTGLNDTDYFPDPYSFAECYRQKCEYVKSVDPDIDIYVCSMLPPSDDLGAERDDLARAPEYDAALTEMCMNNGYGYLELKWMVKQELYLEDGIHFDYDFYEIWLQYTALCLQL